jgi:YVTN family beta-propeller protein
VWVVVRGENYISVIDPATFKEVRRIETQPGPGMVVFHPDGKLAFVVSSFTPVAEVIDVKAHKVIKRLPVVSPFSPFLQFTPDYKEVWMTHKDVGKVTRIDTGRLEVKGVFDTGFITNHLGFAKTAEGTRAYVTVGGENTVKVYTTDDAPKLVANIPVGALPHGIWPSNDGSRIYVGLENGDAVEVIDTATNKVIGRVPVGQAPQALVYVSGAAPDAAGSANLAPLANKAPINVQLTAVAGEGKGFVVVRDLGLVDTLDVSVFKLKPQTTYAMYVDAQKTPVAIFKTNATGAANTTAIGPLREVVGALSAQRPAASKITVVEGDASAAASKAVLVGN